MNLSKRLLSTGLSLSLLFSGATCSCVEKKPSAWRQTPRAVKSAVEGLGVGAAGLLLACCYYRADRNNQRCLKGVAQYERDEARRERDWAQSSRDEARRARDNAQRERFRLERELIQVRGDLDEARSERDRLQRDLDGERAHSNRLVRERNQVRARARELEERLAHLPQNNQDAEGRMYAMQLALTERMLGNVGDGEARRNLRLCEQYLTAKLDLHYTPEGARDRDEKVARVRELEGALNELRGRLAGIDDDEAAKREGLILCTITWSYYLPVDVQYCGVFCDDGPVHAVSTQAAVDNAQNPRSHALDRCPCCKIPTHYFVPEAH